MAEDQIINEEEFSDFSSLELAQNDVQSVEGTNASGEAQTTIVDEGGNLKIIEKPKTQASSKTKNEVDESNTSPGMAKSAPTGTGTNAVQPPQVQTQTPSVQPQVPQGQIQAPTMPTPSAPMPNQGDMVPVKPAPAPQGQGSTQPPAPTGSELPSSQPQQMQMPEPRSTDMPNG